MSEETTKPVRRKRTVEELKAHYSAKLKEVEEKEKMELLRLLSGAHDDLFAASTHPQAKICAAPIQAALAQTKAALAALDKK